MTVFYIGLGAVCVVVYFMISGLIHSMMSAYSKWSADADEMAAIFWPLLILVFPALGLLALRNLSSRLGEKFVNRKTTRIPEAKVLSGGRS